MSYVYYSMGEFTTTLEDALNIMSLLLYGDSSALVFMSAGEDREKVQ